MRRTPRLLWALSALLALYLLAPFLAGGLQVQGGDWAHADLKGLAHATLVSLGSATVATGLVALGGVPLGYVLARSPGRAVRVLGFVVQLPLALPPLSSGVLLLFLLGYASPLGRAAGGALTDSFFGIVLAEVFVSAPFVIIAARSAFSSVDPLLADVAASLGHGPAAVFIRVDLAVAWPLVLAGLLLGWLRAFGEFGATVMVAYHPFSLPVFTYVAFGSQGLPAMGPVLVVTLAAAVLVLALMQAVRRPSSSITTVSEAPAPLPASAVLSAPAAGARLIFFGRQTLPGFTLAVTWDTSAARLAILGASGSGKSLTLRLIAGLGRAERSDVVFADRDLGRLPPEKRRIAYVPQTYGLMPHLSVREQVAFAVDSEPERARRWMTKLNLDALSARRPNQLSLGQQQRVALARALARPSSGLLLLDEPFAALDTPLRARLRQELLALQSELDLTTILVTHDPAEAILLADEILLLDEGRVLQSGPTNEVFCRPVNEIAARLLGAEVIGSGWITDDGRIDVGDQVRLRAGGPALVPGAAVGWAFSPHRVYWGVGGYPVTVLSRTPVVAGRCQARIRLGDAELDLPAGSDCPCSGRSQITIDPEAFQVWTLAPFRGGDQD